MKKMCSCLAKPRKFREACKDVGEEVKELIEEPNLDELSDVCFTFGRLLASVLGKTYIRFPGDSRCLRKMEERVAAHGCIRSLRHPRCSTR